MNRLWRVAGALCIAHVVLLLAGYSQQRSPVFGASPSSIVSTYGGAATTKMYIGGYIVTVAWLILLAAVTLLARLVRGTGDVSGWFASLSVAAGRARGRWRARRRLGALRGNYGSRVRGLARGHHHAPRPDQLRADAGPAR